MTTARKMVLLKTIQDAISANAKASAAVRELSTPGAVSGGSGEASKAFGESFRLMDRRLTYANHGREWTTFLRAIVEEQSPARRVSSPIPVSSES